MNERYQKNTAPAGKTRRSAASAKPKRATSDTPAKKSSAKGSRPAYHPPTEEYKKLRWVWWSFIGASIVLSTVAWLMWRDPGLRNIGTAVLAAGYGFIAAAIWLDFSKLKPLRQEWMKSQNKGQS